MGSLQEFFVSMGFIRYPLVIIAVFLLVEIVHASMAVARANGESVAAVSARIHPVLVWGVLGAVIGVIGTVVGIALAASYLERAGGGEPALIWGGIKVALGPTIVGMLLLGVASIAWLSLQFGNGRRGAPAV
ncbi:MAG: MotA/TolQ/ExbB proton channel family protein [Gemmatimonadota bacterium]|nr:MotA/TolQ/ExbB proton channel family protein [Gemmatimonadota bacterium]